jgi:hypothetical protein
MTDEQFKNLCNTYGFAPSRSLRELLDSATAQAVISEREACAAMVEDMDVQHPKYISAAIRARGQS